MLRIGLPFAVRKAWQRKVVVFSNVRDSRPAIHGDHPGSCCKRSAYPAQMMFT